MKTFRVLGLAFRAMLLGAALVGAAAAQTITSLADQPVFATVNVPGNLALVLSVEFPTAISVANLGSYVDSTTPYLGYFDSAKCYVYLYNATSPTSSYFKPASFGTGTYGHQCSAQWSGNFMNWAATQTIDPFRSALTGGYRSVDTVNQTILEKAWASNQGSEGSNYPNKGTYEASGNNLPTALVPTVTPFTTWTNFELSIWNQGNSMVFASVSTSDGGPYEWQGPTQTDVNALYNVHIRVDVCDPTTALGVLGLESNCVQYGTYYKPQGLMQQYANQIKFAAFGYPLGVGLQGGILREPMNYIGPTYPQPLSTAVTTNTTDPEWSSTTGIMTVNPDTATASGSGVSQSGVMNYLNKFGEAYQQYMTQDDVSVLYYAAIRYFENLGNVPTWMNGVTGTELDGFPAVNTWSDPIAYSCQKNFILGIGDDHTWNDYNVGGSTANRGIAMPSAVASDTFNQASTWTANMQALEGITSTPWWGAGAYNATYFIAGLAYGAHVVDIRPDLTGTQTVSTYWMDVAEDQEVENLNPYYLAAKYGGFSVPANYSISNTSTPLPLGEWDTTGNSIAMNGGNTHYQPDNYYEAEYSNQMVAGLKSAFSNIAAAITAYSTAFSISNPTISTSGSLSFSAQYNSSGWTGTVTASTITIGSDGTATATTNWTTNTTLQAQVTGTGWNTNRNIATWSGTQGVAFRAANLSITQQAALVPSYSLTLLCTTASCPYLNYLRGDQSNEVGVTGGTASLRARTLFLGDIVDSATTPVGQPDQPFSEANNPGYTAFKAVSRTAMVYVGANDGMMHGFVGSTGLEQFAYVPSAVIQGPTNTPQVNGLVELGTPNYTHHYYVDATPAAFDVDFGNIGGTTSTPNWHTVLIGGLGKGGMSFYAIDVTNPGAMASESSVAANVLWEYTDTTMGYSFGAPSVFKTAKYGWVVALTSGYNSSSTFGYLYLLNPKTGALLEKIATPLPSSGLTQATAYVQDYTDSTADSVYVGDLNGQLWRFALTQPKGTTSPYPAPTLLATLKDAAGNAQAITAAPLPEISPTTRQRFVMVGTGQLLSSNDVASAAAESFYAILDGTGSSFTTATLPITRANLTAVTNVTAGVVLTTSSQGWYIDLGSSSGIGWRVVLNAAAYNGIVAFTDLLTSTNPCSPSGQSRLYAVNFATGKSVLTNNSTGFVTSTTAITNIAILGKGTGNGNSNSGANIYYGSNGPTPVLVAADLASTLATRLLNWREVPTAE